MRTSSSKPSSRLEAQGYELEVVIFTDDVLPDDALDAFTETTYGISGASVL